MLNLRQLTAVLVLSSILLAPLSAAAVLRIDITQGNVDPLPIAVQTFVEDGTDGLGKRLAEVITSNLERSGLFMAIDPSAFIQKPQDMNVSVQGENQPNPFPCSVVALVSDHTSEAKRPRSAQLQIQKAKLSLYSSLSFV